MMKMKVCKHVATNATDNNTNDPALSEDIDDGFRLYILQVRS